jgi:dTDP-4-dehydrorhamnose reductase
LAGIYHVAAAGETSWFEYATHVIEWARTRGVAIRVPAQSVLPISTSAYPTPATRPLNSRLDTSKFRSAFGLALPDWRVGIDRMLTEHLGH